MNLFTKPIYRKFVNLRKAWKHWRLLFLLTSLIQTTSRLKTFQLRWTEYLALRTFSAWIYPMDLNSCYLKGIATWIFFFSPTRQPLHRNWE